MRTETAKTIRDVLLSTSEAVNSSILAVSGTSQSACAEEYRKLAATLLGRIFSNILMPLYAEHPEVEPPELRDPSWKAPPPMSLETAKAVCDVVEIVISSTREVDRLAAGDGPGPSTRRREERLQEIVEAAEAIRHFVERIHPSLATK